MPWRRFIAFNLIYLAGMSVGILIQAVPKFSLGIDLIVILSLVFVFTLANWILGKE